MKRPFILTVRTADPKACSIKSRLAYDAKRSKADSLLKQFGPKEKR